MSHINALGIYPNQPAPPQARPDEPIPVLEKALHRIGSFSALVSQFHGIGFPVDGIKRTVTGPHPQVTVGSGNQSRNPVLATLGPNIPNAVMVEAQTAGMEAINSAVGGTHPNGSAPIFK